MRWLVFALTFISYAFYHASRKNLSGVKGSIINEWLSNTTHESLFDKASEASNFLGVLDAVFMMFYAIALAFWGYVGDRWNPLYVIVIGTFGSGLTLIMFGAFPYYTHFYSIIYYLFFYALFGIAQAAGWPNEVTIMANWFNKTNRGFIMGLWAACQPVGNILGAIIVSLIQPFGYELTFIVNSALICIMGLAMLKFLKVKPSRPHTSSSSDFPDSFESTVDDEDSTLHRPISMLKALVLPNVLPYCLCNACLKFVNYAFFFWLPFYLHTNFKWNESKANQLSAWYDFGGIIGSVVGGLISDRLGHRSPVITTMLLSSLGLLVVYSDVGANQLANVVVMTLLGLTISGPYNLIVGTISVDLGSQEALSGNSKAMSTVTGLIDASGSIGSAVGQLFVPLTQNQLGWTYVFYLFIFMNTLSILCLLRRVIHDVKDLLRSRRQVGVQDMLSGAEETSPLLYQS